MSFILDALKKSESDRQQRVSPGIADVPTATGQAAAPRWIPVLIGLLVINLAVVLYVLFRPSTPTADAGAQVIESVPPAPDPEPARMAARIDPASRPAADGAGTGISEDAPDAGTLTREPARPPANDGDAFQAVSAAGSPVATAEVAAAESASVPASASAPEQADTARAPAEEEAWLTLNDLRASGGIDLPELHIDLHVYSQNPAERFVFINMQQYRENATMAEGPLVRRITPEGALLDYRGSTFLLPRD